jgi:hypothetical protein
MVQSGEPRKIFQETGPGKAKAGRAFRAQPAGGFLSLMIEA